MISKHINFIASCAKASLLLVILGHAAFSHASSGSIGVNMSLHQGADPLSADDTVYAIKLSDGPGTVISAAASGGDLQFTFDRITSHLSMFQNGVKIVLGTVAVPASDLVGTGPCCGTVYDVTLDPSVIITPEPVKITVSYDMDPTVFGPATVCTETKTAERDINFVGEGQTIVVSSTMPISVHPAPFQCASKP